jgi:hypothetical protein
MTIPTSIVSLSNLQASLGGVNPIGLNEYYLRGNQNNNGLYTPAVPTSGAVSLAQFRGANAAINYNGRSSPTYTFNACMGFSVDAFNGGLRVTVGYWGTGNTDSWTGLTFKTTASSTSGLSEIAQFTLTAANKNVVQYGTIASGNMLFFQAQIFSNPVLAYGNNVNTSGGSEGAPGAAWMVAASWNGTNEVYVYLNPSRNGTGDTGTSISMSNMGSAIDFLNGGAGTSGAPAIAFIPG